MIIDIHGHYTTYPPGVEAYRGAQIAQMSAPSKGKMNVTDDEIHAELERSMEEYRRDPAAASNWQQVKARVLARRHA